MINLPSRDYTLAATSSDSEIENMQQVIDALKADPSSLSIGVQPASADYANLMLDDAVRRDRPDEAAHRHL